MLVCVHGSVTALRCEQESSPQQGSSRPFSALVEAAEAMIRGADLQDQAVNEVALIKDSLMKESLTSLNFQQNVSSLQQSTEEIGHLNTISSHCSDLHIPTSDSFENFTKLKSKEQQEIHVLTVAADKFKNQQNLKETEELEYTEKELVSELNNMENAVTDNSQIKAQIKEAQLNIEDNSPESIIIVESSKDTETLESDNTKSVPVKKRQTRSSIKDNVSTGYVYVMQKKKSSPSKSPNIEKCEQLTEVHVPSMVIDESKEVPDEGGKTPKVAKSSKGTQSGALAEKPEEYLCEYCPFRSLSRKSYSDHTRIHLSNPTKCDICDKVFPNERYMKRHRDTHNKPSHRCDHCGKVYKAHKALRNHIKTHDVNYKPPEFKCDICDKSFCTSYILQCHKKSEHEGIKKSFLCSTCGKSFTTKHTLQQHVNVHIGARPYKCDKCDKAFCYESALRDHKFIHEGTKKFICSYPLCNKAFRQRSALKMHEKIHKTSKDFVCDCGRGFTQKQALQRHIRSHEGEKPYWCKICLRSFGDAAIIRRHLISVHKIHKDPSRWREDIVIKASQLKDKEQKTLGEEIENTVNDVIMTSMEIDGSDSIEKEIKTKVDKKKKMEAKPMQIEASESQDTVQSVSDINSIALRMGKTPWSFAHSECNRNDKRKNKPFEYVPVQVLQVPVADFQAVGLSPSKDKTHVKSHSVGGHSGIGALQPNTSIDSHSEELNYEYIVTHQDDTPFDQLAKPSEIDHADYTKAPLVDKSVRVAVAPAKTSVSSDEVDTSLGLIDITNANHLTATRDTVFPEVSTVLAGITSQEDLTAIVRSLDQAVTGTPVTARQELSTARKISEIARQLVQEGDAAISDNEQMQALYSYYSALANHYYNVPIAQYSSFVQLTENNAHQE